VAEKHGGVDGSFLSRGSRQRPTEGRHLKFRQAPRVAKRTPTQSEKALPERSLFSPPVTAHFHTSLDVGDDKDREAPGRNENMVGGKRPVVEGKRPSRPGEGVCQRLVRPRRADPSVGQDDPDPAGNRTDYECDVRGERRVAIQEEPDQENGEPAERKQGRLPAALVGKTLIGDDLHA
jgi:hypothetical protein